MATATVASVDLTVQCLCRTHTFTTSVPHSALPLKAVCCHCNSCRHISGAMYNCSTLWPGPGEDIKKSSLLRYQFSKAVTAMFCGTCSSPMFAHLKQNPADLEDAGIFHVTVGMLPNLPGVDLVKIAIHLFVGDTIDGGASVFMTRPNPDGVAVPRWKGMPNVSEQVEPSWPSQEQLQKAMERPLRDEIPIRCHCRGVDFVLRRGNADFAAMPLDKLTSFVDPDSHKLAASYDACDTCRLMFGSHFVYWTFSFLQHVEFAQDAGSRNSTRERSFPRTTLALKDAITGGKEPRFGTLAMYASSPDVQRYYCSRCSASIFYAADDLPDQVDVAIGVLEAPEGARAESWLEWEYGRMGHSKDVSGGWREGHADLIKKGSEKWRVERGIPKSLWRIKGDEKEAAEKAAVVG